MTTTLDELTLAKGDHRAREEGMCVMEAVAFVAGEPHSDHPACASEVIGTFLRSWNDAMNDEDRQMLKPLVPRLVGTKGTAAQERQRSYMALDWSVRVSTPAWLRLAKLDEHAAALEACAPITNAASAEKAQPALNRARTAASPARPSLVHVGDAVGDAAWDAVGAAARDAAGAAARAATRAAVGDAAWAAARAAAWAVARDAAWAAVGDAARAAAWAALRPTVETLQRSALDLVERMIAVAERRTAE